MSSLAQRILSAVIGIPLFIGLVAWGEFPFALAVCLLAIMGLGEMLRAYRTAGIAVNLPAALAGLVAPVAVCLILIVFGNPEGTIGVSNFLEFTWRNGYAIALFWLLLVMLWEVVRAARTAELHSGRNMGYGLMCGAYISLFAGVAWLRSNVPGPVGEYARSGMYALLLTVFCVWATDSAAYFVGRSLGKHKLAPLLSPGKTVEGGIGGAVTGAGFGALFGWLFFHNTGLGLAVGAIAGVFGQAGDLFKSALKRELGIKDFGAILPGHGGVLDRFDSLLFVAPLAALLFRTWPG